MMPFLVRYNYPDEAVTYVVFSTLCCVKNLKCLLSAILFQNRSLDCSDHIHSGMKAVVYCLRLYSDSLSRAPDKREY